MKMKRIMRRVLMSLQYHMDMGRFDLVIPAVKTDLADFENKIKFYYKMLPIKKIVILGNDSVCDYVNSFQRTQFEIEVINENELISYYEVKKAISSRDSSIEACKRTGWYLQQFLKMYYAYICQDEYYLVWDMDTIPTKNVVLFEDYTPVFHLKTEYHKPYFDTLETLGLGFAKEHHYSFIAEHMLINTELMKKLIQVIERANVQGNNWYVKIINSINLNDLPRAGFSEFETYGNFVFCNYKDRYKYSSWKSLREGKAFFDLNTISSHLDYLSKYYDAISFEKSGNLSGKKYLFWQKKIVQSIFPPCTIQYFIKMVSFLNRIKNRISLNYSR